jgi:hypothetical protein
VVQVSGRGSTVDFTLDDSAPFSQITKELRDYLVENRGLWAKGTIGVNAGRWILSQDQLGLIKHIIESESGLTVGRFWSTPSRLEKASNSEPVGSSEPGNGNGPAPVEAQPNNGPSGSLPIHNAATESEHPPKTVPSQTVEPPFSPLPKLKSLKAGSSRKGLPTEALFVTSTFRSGESITYAGDVVVLADVNPGAEIIAEGDIVVFGSLRGMAHAGSSGDTKATIIALELDSPRIQIGPYTGLAPGDKAHSITKAKSKSAGTGPKIAYAKRRSVYVSPYAGRFARYSRGILYDG